MKTVVRSYVWWPRLDWAIELHVRQSSTLQLLLLWSHGRTSPGGESIWILPRVNVLGGHRCPLEVARGASDKGVFRGVKLSWPTISVLALTGLLPPLWSVLDLCHILWRRWRSWETVDLPVTLRSWETGVSTSPPPEPDPVPCASWRGFTPTADPAAAVGDSANEGVMHAEDHYFLRAACP